MCIYRLMLKCYVVLRVMVFNATTLVCFGNCCPAPVYQVFVQVPGPHLLPIHPSLGCPPQQKGEGPVHMIGIKVLLPGDGARCLSLYHPFCFFRAVDRHDPGRMEQLPCVSSKVAST